MAKKSGDRSPNDDRSDSLNPQTPAGKAVIAESERRVVEDDTE